MASEGTRGLLPTARASLAGAAAFVENGNLFTEVMRVFENVAGKCRRSRDRRSWSCGPGACSAVALLESGGLRGSEEDRWAMRGGMRRRAWGMLVLVCWLLGPAGRERVWALRFGTNELVEASTAGKSQRPRVAFTEDGRSHILWVMGPEEEQGVYVVSADEGGVYGEAELLSPALGQIMVEGHAGPTLRARGMVLAAGWTFVDGGSRSIWARGSLDGGGEWFPALRADPQVDVLRGYQAAASFGDGRLAVAWLEYPPGEDEPSMYWAVQESVGGPFGAPVVASEATYGYPNELSWPDQVVLDDDQTVLLTYRNCMSTLRNIILVRSTDGGRTFPEVLVPDRTHWFSGTPLETGPSIAAEGSVVLVTWRSRESGARHIYVVRSTDGGASWSSNVQLEGEDAGEPDYPQVAIGGGIAVVVWYEPYGPDGYPAIMAVLSEDGGVTWQDPVLVTDDEGTEWQYRPSVAISRRRIIEVVWEDARTGEHRIFRARAGVPTPFPTPMPPPTPTARPDPVPTRTPTEVPATGTPPPTVTLTATPTASPTPVVTPTEEPVYGVSIEMPRWVGSGEQFWVRGIFQNPGPPRSEVPTVFALEVYGEYWFWDDWEHYAPPEATGFDYVLVHVPMGTSEIAVVPEFVWPDTGEETMEGLRFYGAFLTPDLSAIDGRWSMVEWGYGPR
jgi:hypothetical protein